MLELSKKINYDDLAYHFKGKYICEKSFNDFNIVFSFLRKIRDGNITLGKAKKIKVSINQIWMK